MSDYCDTYNHKGISLKRSDSTGLEPECIDQSDECSGSIEYREPLSATGKSFPRCELHWSLRLDLEEEISNRYPDSPVAPPWFDEAYAGERWDEDY